MVSIRNCDGKTKKKNHSFFFKTSGGLQQRTAADNENRLRNTSFSTADKYLQDSYLYILYACFSTDMYSQVLAACYETTATTSQQSHVTGKVKVFRDLSPGAYMEAEVLRALHEVVQRVELPP